MAEPALSQQDAVLTAVTAWEAQNLRALREAEARALREQEQEQLLTYTREDAYNAVGGRAPPPRGPRRSRQPRRVPGEPCRDFRFRVGFSPRGIASCDYSAPSVLHVARPSH